MKRIAQWVLLGFVGVGLAYAVIKPRMQEPPGHAASDETSTRTEAQATVEVAESSPVTVTYFTTRARCVSCRRIESLTKETLTEMFATEMAEGKLRFDTISIDTPGNEHYIQEYELSFKTVVVANSNAGTWQKLDEVWELMGDAAKFKAYVANAVAKQLEGVS